MVIQVLKEGVELVLSWIKTHAYNLGITTERVQDQLRIPDITIDLHLQLPAGAQMKYGPSAGQGVPWYIVQGSS